jgi:hypothetical protein
MSAFTPVPVKAANDGGTYVMNVTNASSSITLPARPGTIRIMNGGTKTAFIEVGPTAYVPTGATPGSNTGSMPLLSGAGSIPLLIEKGNATTISAICAGTDTTTLYITLGLGDTVG